MPLDRDKTEIQQQQNNVRWSVGYPTFGDTDITHGGYISAGVPRVQVPTCAYLAVSINLLRFIARTRLLSATRSALLFSRATIETVVSTVQ